MATTVEQWRSAYSVLNGFERQTIEPKEFTWKYITEQSGVSKATLWRNKDFLSEYHRVQGLVRGYSKGAESYNLQTSLKDHQDRYKDYLIEGLRKEIADLTAQLCRERERLIYAAMTARRRNIDPLEFMEGGPLGSLVRPKASVTQINERKKPARNKSLTSDPPSITD